MTSCYMCMNEALEKCSKCDQPYCIDHKALKIGSICLQCGGKQSKRLNRGMWIVLLMVIVFIPLIGLIIVLTDLL